MPTIHHTLQISVVFDNAADRNTWYDAIRSRISQAKASLPPYLFGTLIKRIEISDSPSDLDAENMDDV